jgi:hypothetical protein
MTAAADANVAGILDGYPFGAQSVNSGLDCHSGALCWREIRPRKVCSRRAGRLRHELPVFLELQRAITEQAFCRVHT